MLSESRLYTFLNHKENYLLHFFVGEKLIRDLALIHSMNVHGFTYFRDAVLTFMPMVSLLKSGENLGLYIDSEDPKIRLKIETNAQGLVRTLLLPENLDNIPPFLTGKARLNKNQSDGHSYTSVINLEHIALQDIVNKILIESYQISGSVILGLMVDQSLLVTKLPDTKNEDVTENLNLSEYIKKYKIFFDSVLNKCFENEDEVLSAFSNTEFNFLSSKTIRLFCGCTKERMISYLWALKNETPEGLFGDNEKTLEIVCDYCKKKYVLSKNDFVVPNKKS